MFEFIITLMPEGLVCFFLVFLSTIPSA